LIHDFSVLSLSLERPPVLRPECDPGGRSNKPRIGEGLMTSIKRFVVTLTCGAALAAGPAWGGPEGGRPPDGAILATAAEAGNEFAWKTFSDVLSGESSDKNVLYSPLSALIVLAMTANGAEGETRAEMLKALALGDGEARMTEVNT